MESKREPSKYDLHRTRQKPDFKIDAAINHNKLPEYNGLKDPNLTGFFSGKRVKKILVKQRMITAKGHILEKPSQLPYTNTRTQTKKAKDAISTQRSESTAANNHQKTSPTKSKPRTKSKLATRSKELKPMTKEELKQVIKKFKPLAKTSEVDSRDAKSIESASFFKIDTTQEVKISKLPSGSTQGSKIPELEIFSKIDSTQEIKSPDSKIDSTQDIKNPKSISLSRIDSTQEAKLSKLPSSSTQDVKNPESISLSKIDSTQEAKLSKLPSSSNIDSTQELIISEEKFKKIERPGKTGDDEISLPKEDNTFYMTVVIKNEAADRVSVHGMNEEVVGEDLDEVVLSEEIEEEADL